MPRRREEEPRIPNVREALNLRTVEDCKKLLSLLPTQERPTRKGDLVDLIENHLSGELSPDETLLLETYAEKEADTVWHLSREKALAAVESGSQIKELRDFLAACDEQELPEPVEGFLATTERRARACVNKGTALLVECADAEIAEQIATSERMKKLCLRAGEKHLVVMVDAEEQFRKALRLLGYRMPRV